MTEYKLKKNEETINDVSLKKETVWINPYKLPFEMTDALCHMMDMNGYIACIKSLKEKYKNAIQIYLGCEEDAFSPVERTEFDYIIGSSHYFCVNDKYYPIDSNYDNFKRCVELFNGAIVQLAKTYYENYVIKK